MAEKKFIIGETMEAQGFKPGDIVKSFTSGKLKVEIKYEGKKE